MERPFIEHRPLVPRWLMVMAILFGIATLALLAVAVTL
jgi:hypothetical protein